MSDLDSFAELVHGTYSMRSDAIEQYATLKAQRDELLASLIECVGHIQDTTADQQASHDRANKLIAKAEAHP